MNALVILNPHARGGAARRLAEPLQRTLASLDITTTWCSHEHWQDSLAVIEACAPGTRIVAMGGDGTVNRYLPALLAGGHSLGIVPCGSGNDLARAVLGTTQHGWSACLRHALQGPLHALDVGVAQVGDHTVPFLSSLTMGFDSSVARRAMTGPGWLWGRPRYLFALVKELRALRNWPVTIDADGIGLSPGEVLFASVLNTPTFGGGVLAVPQARPDDGLLNLLLAQGMGRGGVLSLVTQMLVGTHLRNAAVSERSVRRLRLRSARPIPVATDGNDLGDADQVVISLHPKRLPIVSSPASLKRRAGQIGS